MRILLAIMTTIFLSFGISAQGQFTPYDDLPGVNKSFKPTLQDDAPAWAKLMYSYPINFFELKKEYDAYQASSVKKNPYTRYYKHWSRLIAPLVDADGVIHMPDEREIHTFLTSNRSRESHLHSRNGGNWTFLGPQVTHWLKENNSSSVPAQCPWQVNIYCIDIAKTNPNTMYCGTETGVINKTTDKGITWQLVTKDYYTGGGVNDIVIHPTNPDIVYAAAGNQIHKTTDGGQTWKTLLTSVFFDANKLKISSDGKKLFASSETGIYISNDEGLTWQKKSTLKAYDVEIKPNDESIIYALGAVNQTFRIQVSTDGGENFTTVTNFLSTYKDGAGGVLAVTAANPNLVMMTLLSDNETPIIVKGELGNLNTFIWSEVVKGKTTKLPLNNGQGYYDLDMEISPTDASRFVVATTTMYKTANNGLTFTAVGGYDGPFPIHPDIQDLKFEANGEVWVATDGGLSMSTDFFNNQSNFFVLTNGIIGSDFWGFDQGWNEDIIVAGRYHNGNTAIADFYQPKAIRMGGAESPTGWVIQGKSRHVAFDDLGGGWVLPAKVEDRYEDRFLFSKFPNMDEYGGRRGSLIHHPYYHNHLYVGEGNAIWLSTDAGMTWEMLHQFTNRVMTIQIGAQQPDIIYADIVGLGLHRSEDGGKTWVRKPSLTAAPNGSSNWNGKLSIATSPHNADIVYACLQNGTWSADKGKIFKSIDGGSTWKNITFGIDAYLKSLVVQPAADNKDVLYLFSNAKNNLESNVWILNENSSQWESFNINYPMGFSVNHVLPFYRDNKIRVAGNMGVWESNIATSTYEPIIRPWAERAVVPCVTDTITMDDHSIMPHSDVTWAWTIDPTPNYISSTSVRNPKIVLGQKGKYSVTLKITSNGKTYEKRIDNMIEAKQCPSVETCNNPARLSKEQWQVTDFDSEEVGDPGRASMAIDGDVSTIWHTRWSSGNDPYPHHISLDLGREYNIFEFIYLPRQDGGENGRVKDYEIYFALEADDWGSVVAKGSFENSAAPKVVKIQDSLQARYIQFRALSEVNGNPWASAAEFDFKGCYAELSTTENSQLAYAKISPVPAYDNLTISLPKGVYSYTIYTSTGKLVSQSKANSQDDGLNLNIESYIPGIYNMVAINEKGIQFKMRFVKM